MFDRVRNSTSSPLVVPFLVLLLCLSVGSASAEEADATEEQAAETADTAGDEAEAKKEAEKKGSAVKARYKNGLHLESEDGNFAAKINWRAQLRLTDLKSPVLFGEEDGVVEESGFLIRRARFKMSGHAYRPWLRFKMEYGLVAAVLLTLRLEIDRIEEAGLWAGQYKVLYNRERVVSSGKQQFVDRSIVNNPFTVDRQQGLTLQGRLFAGKRADFNYALGWFTGTGRGGGLDSEERGMYTLRWQWNFLKRVLPFSESDLKRYKPGRGSFALAAASNIGRFTRFSSSGGGQLPGFAPGLPGQYKLDQWMAEFAYMRRGLSAQSEYHYKKIDDRVNLQITELDGWYAQIGYFFSEAFRGFPRPLEFAFRVAEVNPITSGSQIRNESERTLCANWFFNGQNNKLTLDATHLTSKLGNGPQDDGWRARLQWDISF